MQRIETPPFLVPKLESSILELSDLKTNIFTVELFTQKTPPLPKSSNLPLEYLYAEGRALNPDSFVAPIFGGNQFVVPFCFSLPPAKDSPPKKSVVSALPQHIVVKVNDARV